MNKKATWACLLGGLGLVICGLSIGGEGDARAPRRTLTKSASRRPTLLASMSSSFRSLPTAALRSVARGAPLKKMQHLSSAPVSLTASDGTGLSLLSLRAQAAVEGPLAMTELHLAFQNPRDRTIEGRFEITLPTGATISRFAMRLPSGWQEAEVVERQAARKTYESYLHLRRDPALLEKKAGNTFRARVFPIPAKGIKELIVSYSQQLSEAEPTYRLRLRGLPKLQRLELAVVLGQAQQTRAASTLGGVNVSTRVVRVSKRNYQPQADFALTLPKLGDGLRHQNLVVARIRPQLPRQAGAPFSGLAVLVDTSASRAVGLAAQVELLQALVDQLARRHGPQVRLEVAAFDQGVEPIYRGTLGGFGRAARERILLRRGLGASNLQAALGWARRLRGIDRLLLISDGVATAGATKTRELRVAVKALPASVRRLDVLLVGAAHDRPAMQRLVTGARPADGVLLDSEQPVSELAERLGQVTVSGIEVQIAGARWIWPSVLDGVQPGQTTLVYADVPKLPAGRALEVKLGGRLQQRIELRLAPAARPLLEREWVRARIERLEHRHDTLGEGKKIAPKEVAALKKRIVELSTRYRVLSDHTAMIVLESESEYRRFNISRRALADVLTVGPFGVRVVQRRGVHFSPLPGGIGGLGGLADASMPGASAGVLGILRGRGGSQLASVFGRDSALGGSAAGTDANDAMGGLIGSQIGESYGIGGMGTIGKGGAGGAGYGRGSAIGGRRARAPRVRLSTAVVRGALDSSLIRRVVRRHINEVKFCYQRELQSRPSLSGRVTVRFTIGSTGKVLRSKISRTTLHNANVERCIARAVRRWSFPMPPGGGIVIVSYPFALHPAGQPRPVAVRRSRRAFDRAIDRLIPVRNVKPAPRKPRKATAPERYRAIGQMLAQQKTQKALAEALRWHSQEPTHVLALLSLGQALEASDQKGLAARAYGSLIDLYPSRAAMLRYAAERLEAFGKRSNELAVDAYQRALSQRPDHVTGYRLLAWAQHRAGHSADALATLERAFVQDFPSWRNRNDWQRVLREDLGLIAAAWVAAKPARRAEVVRRLKSVSAKLATTPSLRFVLSWETDANDVDLHVYDARGGHAYYSSRGLPSGGQLYEDVTNGYGPEVFNIPGKATAYPYRLGVMYYSRGAMGFGLGTVQVIAHDGRGGLRFEFRPFAMLENRGVMPLGTVAQR